MNPETHALVEQILRVRNRAVEETNNSLLPPTASINRFIELLPDYGLAIVNQRTEGKT